jgi:hypothetical protein
MLVDASALFRVTIELLEFMAWLQSFEFDPLIVSIEEASFKREYFLDEQISRLCELYAPPCSDNDVNHS